MTQKRDDLLADKIDTAEALVHGIDLGGYDFQWLRDLHLAEQTIASAIRTGVEKARGEGATWQAIAASLGLNSRQAAEARYGNLT
jgi:hypothetical protein